jgi:hypothetical protein
MALTIENKNNAGALRVPGSSEFMTFNSPQEGISAQESLLMRYHKRDNLRNVRDIVEKYAPRKSRGGDNTDEQVNNYINYVSGRLGVNPLDTIGDNLIPKMAGFMREFETGKTQKGVKPKNPYNVTTQGGNDMVAAAATALGMPLKNYTVAKPGANETTTGVTTPQIDVGTVQSKANEAVTTSDRYAQFIKDSITPLIQNSAQQIERQQAIVGIKRNIVNDFANREAALEQKLRPLMAQREAIAAQMLKVDQLNPLEARFKAVFNPREYDPRILRGKLERVENAIGVYQGDYEELNKLRSGVAAASVDAETSDMALLNLGQQSTTQQLQLLGQVAGVVKQNASDQLFPAGQTLAVMTAQEATKQSLLGKLTLEKTVDLFHQAQASPSGTVTMDGVTMTVGELQKAAQGAQQQDLTFRSMVNSFKTSDLNTTEALESNYIDHMTPEQITEALKNGGKIKGADGTEYQLSTTKLTQAYAAATALQAGKVQNIVNTSAVGLAGETIKQMGTQVKATGQRAQEIFGSIPGEYQGFLNTFTSQVNAWAKGLDDANKQGVGKEYIAANMGTLNALQKAQDDTISTIAKKWGGGKEELATVAENYLRGNPLSGDTALKGLIVIARSGNLPNGAQFTGPAAQAFAVAKATVQEWDQPQGGDSLDTLLKGGQKKETDLMRLVQQRVAGVYADGLADAITNDLPQIARGVRDPNNQNRLHPFARVSRDDFLMAVQHGRNQAYEIMSNKMGVDPNTAKRIFASGPDSQDWKDVAKKKGWAASEFNDRYSELQASEMAETLSALDASHSAAPGFSPAKAYIDFLQTPEVKNRVAQAVQSYGQNGGFSSYLISSSAGGGFQDAWNGYTDNISSTYIQMHSKELQQRVSQLRKIGGDPWTKFNAINQAAGLTREESTYLMQAIKPYANVSGLSEADVMGSRNPAFQQNIADRNATGIQTAIMGQKLDDPKAEALRKRVAGQWHAMESLVGTVLDSVSN